MHPVPLHALFGIPWWGILVIVIIVISISKSAGRKRRVEGRRARTCPGCAAEQPAYANYCRRCGRKLV